MNTLIRSLVAAAMLSVAVSTALGGEKPDVGAVEFGKFKPPGSGGEFVEVNVKSNLISMIARLAEKAEPEVAAVIRGLKQVRVNVIGLTDENRTEVHEKVASIREELEALGWERLVSVQDGKDDIRVYLKTRGDEAVEGLVITVLDGGQDAVLVNIVGDIKPEKIAMVGERLNLKPLQKVAKMIE